MADDAPAVAPPGTAAHPVVDDGKGGGADAGSSAPSAARTDAARRGDTAAAGDQPDTEPTASAMMRDVAASGTALHEGERTSDLDLDDAPGATGPGAG